MDAKTALRVDPAVHQLLAQRALVRTHDSLRLFRLFDSPNGKQKTAGMVDPRKIVEPMTSYFSRLFYVHAFMLKEISNILFVGIHHPWSFCAVARRDTGVYHRILGKDCCP